MKDSVRAVASGTLFVLLGAVGTIAVWRLLDKWTTRATVAPSISESIDEHVPPPDVARPLLPDSSSFPTLVPLAYLTPTDTSWMGGRPVTIAVDAPPRCRIAVADRGDGAVHIYRADGSYSHTIWDGPRDVSSVSQAISLAFGPSGDIYATNLTWGTLARFESDGTERWTKRLAPSFDSAAFGSHIAVDARGRIFENWFGSQYAIVPGDWSSALPLDRVFSADGEIIGRVGALEEHAGVLFTALMNRHRVMPDGDTAWIAFRVQGILAAYVDNGEGVWQEVRRVELPVFYHMDAPRQSYRVAQDRYTYRTDPHVIDAIRLPGFGFAVVQALRYEPVDGVGLLAHTAIVGYDSDGALLGGFRVRGQILEIEGLGKLVVLLQRSEDYSHRFVAIYENPFWGEVDLGWREPVSNCSQDLASWP